ncbi:MAG: pseudouridine-5'-phosphate glycosidase [Actinomycetota bacterium]|nr:pseudouridine-5'-phosphate glycosidase [Actinomycetota bacterium]
MNDHRASRDAIRVDDEVADAVRDGRPVVALETTVYSLLGLPSPANEDALAACLKAVRDAGAVPALTAVIDGVARVGVAEAEHERVLGARAKVAERDLGVAVGASWPVGVTTVSASLALAARAGVRVFATGGIGGVHRDVHRSGDISADLEAVARHTIVTVCAGAKSFLDLPRTVEHLETLGVTVLGYGTDELPAFTVPSSGVPLPHRVDDAPTAARIAAARWALGGGGLLVAVPVPADAALDATVLDVATTEALADADRAGVSGAAVTPYVLERVATITGGASVRANTALVTQNAAIAAAIAGALATG